MVAPDPVCIRCSKPIRSGTGRLTAAGQTVHHRCVSRDLAMTSMEIGAGSSGLRQRAAALIEQAAVLMEKGRGLPRATAWLATVIESLDDAVIGRRLDGTIVLWNAGAERLYGYSTEEAIGQSLSKLMPPDRTDELSQLLERVQNGEPIRGYDTVRVRKDGVRIEVSLTIRPVKDEADTIVGTVVFVRDLTRDRSRADAQALHWAQDEAAWAETAEEANRLRDDFLAMLSHELRSPLNAIAGWVGVLHSKTEDPAVLGRAADVIGRNTRLLVKLVDDLLNVSRIVSGRLTLEREHVDIARLVDGCLDTMRPEALAKGITLQSMPGTRTGMVWGDAARLQQVIGNLVGNAIKFTPPGGVIEVQVAAGDSEAVITVSDTGRGISREFLPFVFERFRQEDTSSTREHGGLGLGLAIVRHLVELHGGMVEADSPGVGQGARFTVRLPLLTDTEPSRPA
jgi:PAS domain S-box-containing protein